MVTSKILNPRKIAENKRESRNIGFEADMLRRNPPEVQVTSGQKPCTKIINIVLQTSAQLF